MDVKDFFSGTQPIYIQLYEHLKQRITDGTYPYNSRFPSKRVISDRFGVSLITVEHSLELLYEEGYLEARERSGSFVIFREEDFLTTASSQPESVPSADISMPLLASDAPDFPVSSYFKIMRRVITDYGSILLSRVPHSGAPILRQAIADYLARSRGLKVKAEQIYIGAGSEYFYGLLVQLFGKEHTFAIETPSYEKIEQVYRAHDVDPELLPLSDNGIRSHALSASHADILHITPYRSFPSGISTSASKRREYVRWAESRNGYIIEDDFESEFTPSKKPEETVFSLSSGGCVLYLNSFTKTISPAARISYLVLPESLIPRFEERLGFYSCTVPAFDQYVLAEFISSGEFERHINRVRRKKRKEL